MPRSRTVQRPDSDIQQCGWHINVDPGCEGREINMSKMLLGADELPVPISAQRIKGP